MPSSNHQYVNHSIHDIIVCCLLFVCYLLFMNFCCCFQSEKRKQYAN